MPDEQVENRESFFKRFKYRLTPADLEMVEGAYNWAKYGHGYKVQKRESGERYFEHPRATALILVDELGVTDRDLVIAALLHDILEDTYILTSDQIRKNFGDRVWEIVVTVTKPSKNDPRFKDAEERKQFHFKSVLEGRWEAKLIKLVDRIHNTRTLQSCSEEKQLRKRDETVRFVNPILMSLCEEHGELGDKVGELLRAAIEPFMRLR
ncbi:MAG: bifunctional (p)ppGpp synthetase/guanosine-3',5'-bis(diphosphate) 3'-pyrophosphohydrolase [Candidatus Pacebacteria bacterium]|nr:bifunctional (p)ppGpp synthetase/guanosine-3',5'-bis(diphosphate) 3'-pyrophosphohydrolase [Candidatus Paceibacterota bacterium]